MIAIPDLLSTVSFFKMADGALSPFLITADGMSFENLDIVLPDFESCVEPRAARAASPNGHDTHDIIAADVDCSPRVVQERYKTRMFFIGNRNSVHLLD
jgi:hypothetical protein